METLYDVEFCGPIFPTTIIQISEIFQKTQTYFDAILDTLKDTVGFNTAFTFNKVFSNDEDCIGTLKTINYSEGNYDIDIYEDGYCQLKKRLNVKSN